MKSFPGEEGEKEGETGRAFFYTVPDDLNADNEAR